MSSSLLLPLATTLSSATAAATSSSSSSPSSPASSLSSLSLADASPRLSMSSSAIDKSSAQRRRLAHRLSQQNPFGHNSPFRASGAVDVKAVRLVFALACVFDERSRSLVSSQCSPFLWQHPTRSGYMTKRGAVVKSWKLRWCVLILTLRRSSRLNRFVRVIILGLRFNARCYSTLPASAMPNRSAPFR